MPKDQIDIPAEKRNFTIEGFMLAYGVSRARTYSEINAGRLVARKLGGRTLIARADADAWLDALPRYQPTRAAA